jgi:hypothetical protein
VLTARFLGLLQLQAQGSTQIQSPGHSISSDTVRLLVRDTPNNLADSSTIVAAVAAAVAVFFTLYTLIRDFRRQRRQQRGVDARVSAIANAARNEVEGLREKLKLIANPDFDDAALSHQIESWLGRLDPLMLRLAEEIPAASEQKARQLRGALGYFYVAAGELRGAFWDKAALTSVAQRSSDRLGLCYGELGNAMAPEMIVGGVTTTSAGGSVRAEGIVTPPEHNE